MWGCLRNAMQEGGPTIDHTTLWDNTKAASM